MTASDVDFLFMMFCIDVSRWRMERPNSPRLSGSTRRANGKREHFRHTGRTPAHPLFPETTPWITGNTCSPDCPQKDKKDRRPDQDRRPAMNRTAYQEPSGGHGRHPFRRSLGEDGSFSDGGGEGRGDRDLREGWRKARGRRPPRRKSWRQSGCSPLGLSYPPPASARMQPRHSPPDR
jgi:hypothetical protein